MGDQKSNQLIIGIADFLLTFIWYAGLVLLIALTIYELAVPGHGPEVGYPIRFRIEHEGTLQYNPDHAFDVQINRADGELRILDPLPPLLKAYSLVISLLGVGLSLGIIYCLRRIIRTLKTGTPFVWANARRLRWIAVFIFTLGVCERFFVWLNYKLFTSKVLITGIKSQGIGLADVTFGMPWDYLTAAIMVLLLAEVFRIGVDLRAEQELTV